MMQIIKAPLVEAAPVLTGKRWEIAYGDAAEGLGQVIEYGQNHLTESRDQDVACLHSCLVEEGDNVGPGQTVVELWTQSGVYPVQSVSYGTVSGLVPMDENEVIHAGDYLAFVMTREDRSSRKTGLNPKPSLAMRMKRFG
ncbi:MAG: hypothetical protein JO126_08535 [Alphaproteobacteria bacterium]|nr:hypothetical protein [Alphaproteobacteria bacterium]MBV8549488.1 hypothetical protein [Alphaproteobacteria bacterium]